MSQKKPSGTTSGPLTSEQIKILKGTILDPIFTSKSWPEAYKESIDKTKMNVSAQIKGPNWCAFHKQNHHSKTKCSHNSGAATGNPALGKSDTESATETKVEDQLSSIKEEHWSEKDPLDALFTKADLLDVNKEDWKPGSQGAAILGCLISSGGNISTSKLHDLLQLPPYDLNINKVELADLLTKGLSQGVFSNSGGSTSISLPASVSEKVKDLKPKIDIKAHPDYSKKDSDGNLFLQSLVAYPPESTANKITLIKNLREYAATHDHGGSSDLGLKQAKDIVEKAYADGVITHDGFNVPIGLPPDLSHIKVGPKKPFVKKPDTISTVKSLGWSVVGKGCSILDSLNTNGVSGSSVEGIILAHPELKLTPGLTHYLLDQAIDGGFVSIVPGTKPPRYLFGKIIDPAKTLTEEPQAPKVESKPKPVPINLLKGFKFPTGTPKVLPAVGLGGTKEKKFLEYPDGTTLLFKPKANGENENRMQAAIVASDISAKLLGSENSIPVKLYGGSGTVQPYIESEGDLDYGSIKTLGDSKIKQLQNEMVVDFLIFNNDTKPKNFIQTKDGKILGVDKERAFKTAAAEKAQSVKSFFSGKSVYFSMFVEASGNQNYLNPNSILDVIQKVESTPDSEWETLLQPYLKLKTFNTSEVLDAALNRKNKLRDLFEDFYTEVLKGNGTLKSDQTFKFADQQPEVNLSEAPKVLESPKTDKTKELPSAEMPSAADLTPVGSAKGLGGAKDKSFLKDKTTGKTYIFKPAVETWRPLVQQSVSDLTSLIAPQGSFIPVKATKDKDGKLGSIQPYHENIKSNLANVNLKTLTKSQISDIQKERVLDWVFGNHDSHGGNMLLTQSGSIMGCDKEQAFKHISNDKLELNYHPNKAYDEKPPVYNELYKLAKDKEISIDPNDVLPYINNIEKISDDDWKKAVKPYVDALVDSQPNKGIKAKETLMKKILDRKNSVRADFEKFFKTIEGPDFAFKKDASIFHLLPITITANVFLTGTSL